MNTPTRYYMFPRKLCSHYLVTIKRNLGKIKSNKVNFHCYGRLLCHNHVSSFCTCFKYCDFASMSCIVNVRLIRYFYLNVIIDSLKSSYYIAWTKSVQSPFVQALHTPVFTEGVTPNMNQVPTHRDVSRNSFPVQSSSDETGKYCIIHGITEESSVLFFHMKSLICSDTVICIRIIISAIRWDGDKVIKT